MNLMRILVIAVLGLTITPSYAVPVLYTLEGDPFTEWEFAQRDSTGMTTSMDVADTDGDGIASFVAEVDPGGLGDAVHISSGPSECLFVYIILFPSSSDDPTFRFPFLMSSGGDPLIVQLLGASSDMFSLEQRVIATNGTITGLDGLVYENPGITSAVDLLSLDVPLPTFTGEVEVGGLLTIQVIPEPSTGALALLAFSAVGVIVRCGRFVSRSVRPDIQQ
jgi:hypothetical protein